MTIYQWYPTHYHTLLHSSCYCVVPPLLLTLPPPKCSRWCLSPVQSGWWMYHWFPSPPRPLLLGCSPPLVEWSTWQCRSHFPQQVHAMLWSELEKCLAHLEWPIHRICYLDLQTKKYQGRVISSCDIQFCLEVFFSVTLVGHKHP